MISKIFGPLTGNLNNAVFWSVTELEEFIFHVSGQCLRILEFLRPQRTQNIELDLE